jgi:hypothetical protein
VCGSERWKEVGDVTDKGERMSGRQVSAGDEGDKGGW